MSLRYLLDHNVQRFAIHCGHRESTEGLIRFRTITGPEGGHKK